MKSVSFPVLLAILAALAATPAAAQLHSTIPTPIQAPHIATPPGGLTLSTPATSPLQQQMQDDYATQLRAAQQQMLQQNPSGLTRGELNVNRTLNGFSPQ
jgi:hypothetical protein